MNGSTDAPTVLRTERANTDMDMADAMEESIEYQAAESVGRAKTVASSVVPDEAIDGAIDDRYVVKSASLELEVGDAEETLASVEFEVGRLEGFISNVRSYNAGENRLGYRLVVQVPEVEMENLTLTLLDMGEKLSYSFSQQDVTASVTDRDFEIQRLTALRATYLNMLASFEQKPETDLQQIFQVNQEISKVDSQLARMQQQQRKELARVEFATLNLHLRPVDQAIRVQGSDWSFRKSLINAQQRMVRNFHVAVDKILSLLSSLPQWGPVVVIGIIMIIILRRVFRNLMNDEVSE